MRHLLASSLMELKLPGEPNAAEPGEDAAGGSRTGSEDRVTPMMTQYLEIKAGHPDCLLFYRMGDFYELFFQDAEIASRALGIVLTKRGKHLERDIPMCGVPVERAEEYLHRLIALGHRVAVCEQLEDPAEARRRGGKSLVRRDVVRLVTPGTLTEDSLLDARRNNYLAAIARARSSSAEEESRFAIAFLDISTGEFRVTECGRETLAAEIARLEPGEILLSDALYEDAELASFWRSLAAVTPLTRDAFDGGSAERRLAEYFAVATTQAFGAFSRLELTAAAACVSYLERTQRAGKPLLSPPARESSGATLLIDAATRANLELARTLSGERRGSLLSAVDRTVTAAGSRLLAQRLAAPLTAPSAIGERLDSVAALIAAAGARSELIARLRAAPDLARALARLVIGRGGPRDLAAVRDGLTAAAEIAAVCRTLDAGPAEIVAAAAALRAPDPALAAELAAALAEALPALKRDGGLIRAGYRAGLDETRAARDESRRVLAVLQARYAVDTGIRTLKIRHNHVLGYFIETAAQHGEKLLGEPFKGKFIHRQTLAGQIRFTTNELGDLESKIASAADRALALELESFDQLADIVVAARAAIQAAAQALAAIDVVAGPASLAVEQDYVRPEILANLDFVVEGGGPPVVEQRPG